MRTGGGIRHRTRRRRAKSPQNMAPAPWPRWRNSPDAVDAATIATPTPTHFAIAEQLLKAGKHLLVEKPITETTEDARKLVELSHAAGRMLQVGHVERFNPVMSKLEELLTQPRFIEAHRLSPYPNRSIEIGVVLDLMIHDLEIILHLVRSPVKSIDAVGVPVLSRGEDIATRAAAFRKRLRGKCDRQPHQPGEAAQNPRLPARGLRLARLPEPDRRNLPAGAGGASCARRWRSRRMSR